LWPENISSNDFNINKINFVQMKRIKVLLYIAVVAFSTIGIHSCYDDKSTLATLFIDEVVIDTTGIKAEQYIGYQERLTIAPNITIGKGNSESALLYEWSLALFSKNNSEFEVISTDKVFDEVISRPISGAPYTLKLTVIDTKNDNLQYQCLWEVFVQSSFLDGLLISDTRDGNSSDLTLIMNNKITVNYDKEEKIYQRILENAYGAPYNKLMNSLTYELFGNAVIQNSGTGQVWAITDDGECVRFHTEDFSINGTFDDESIMTYKPDGLKFISLFRGYQMFFAYTTSGFYSFMNVSTNSFGWYDTTMKGYSPNNGIIASTSSSSTNSNHTVWLDNNKNQFASYSGSSSLFGAISTYEANTIFDPNAMAGHKAMAAGIHEDGNIATFLLKDNASGEYAIYTLGQYKDADNLATARNKYDIPNEGKGLIDNAVSIFFAQKENVLYVATEGAIYAILYGSGDDAVVSTIPKYSASSGETITKAKLYQQGHHMNDSYVTTSTPPYVTPLEWNNKAIILTTQKGDFEGKVHLLPISQPGIGTLDPSKGLTYDGFGKILDVITVGY
jgi:hypothetical protein